MAFELKDKFKKVTKRLLDLVLVLVVSSVMGLPMLLIAAAVRISSPGPIFFMSIRVGLNNKLFKMPKFRSMRVDTPAVATHLLKNPDHWLTPIGSFLRESSLDELPQLWCILVGDMSFVGPRPALFNQDDLIAMRTKRGVHKLLPGLTGWAQVNGRNAISWEVKFELDVWYVDNRSLGLDIRIIFLTFARVFARSGITAAGEATMPTFTGSSKSLPTKSVE